MQKKLSELLLYEAGIADRPGQYERIIQIAYKVEKLEAIAKRVEEACVVVMFNGKRVAIVPIEEDGE